MARFKCVLQRLKEYENISKPNCDKPSEPSTSGRFSVTDTETGEEIWHCYTIENGGPSTATPLQDKRILARRYVFEWTESKVSVPKNWKPKCLTTICPDDPKHKPRRIHVHIGNYPQDTEACLLLCKVDNKNGTGSQSTIAVDEFFNLVAKHGVENFELEIKEIENA